jgi:hypothetical protein
VHHYHIAYLAAFATALFYGVSAVLEDRSAKLTPVTGKSGKRAALRATLRPMYLVGMVLSVVAWAFSLIALRRLPLFAVQAIAASSIGVVVLLTWAATRHRPTRRQGLLLVALACGLVALAVSAAPSKPKPVGWGFKVAVWVGLVLVVYAAVRATRVAGARGSAVLGAVSGLADGGMALCARAIHHHSFGGLATDPLAIALIPFTVIGVVAFAASLQRGSASIALACQQATLTVVPSAIGLAILGDRARHGFAPLTVAGFVITVAAVLLLTQVTPAELLASEPSVAH